MSKITKKMFDDYNKTNKSLDNSKRLHKKSVDSIKEIIKPMIVDKHKGVNWKITGIEFNYDSYIDYTKKTGDEYEWEEISEKEYYEIYNSKRFDKNFNYSDNLKEEYFEKNDYYPTYYKKVEKKYNYLRVYVYEWWSHGGEDTIVHDFLLSEIMEPSVLRKEKLQKLMED